MNYQVIKCQETLDNFIEWLPELQDGQKFYVCLMCRKKYGKTEGIKSDKNVLKRFTATKEQLKSKIEKLEVKLGSYKTADGIEINQDSLALYITPNPRDMHRAALKTAKEIISLVADNRKIYNCHSLALNQIQVTGVRKYFDIDLDLNEGSTLSILELKTIIEENKLVNKEAIKNNIVKTRGGYHILVELSKISDDFNKSWYTNFSQLKDDRFQITMNNDNLIPVPGCVQSDFIPFLCEN